MPTKRRAGISNREYDGARQGIGMRLRWCHRGLGLWRRNQRPHQHIQQWKSEES